MSWTLDGPGGAAVMRAADAEAMSTGQVSARLLLDSSATHEAASVVRVALAERGGRLELSIADDGVGAPAQPPVRLGGLAGLRDRLAAAGGDLVVDRPTDGFRLVASVPGVVR